MHISTGFDLLKQEDEFKGKLLGLIFFPLVSLKFRSVILVLIYKPPQWLF